MATDERGVSLGLGWTTADKNAVRLAHGWLAPDDRYVCDGCAVREPHEHRCHGRDGGPACQCDLCTLVCDRCEAEALHHEQWGWSITGPSPGDGLLTVLCPSCWATMATDERELHRELDAAEIVVEELEARAEAAEQRVRELRRERDDLGRRLRDAEGQARLFRGATEREKAKLATAVKVLLEMRGEYDCALIEPADPSLPPSGVPCRERRPDDPGSWCYSCIAARALSEIEQGDMQ